MTGPNIRLHVLDRLVALELQPPGSDTDAPLFNAGEHGRSEVRADVSVFTGQIGFTLVFVVELDVFRIPFAPATYLRLAASCTTAVPMGKRKLPRSPADKRQSRVEHRTLMWRTAQSGARTCRNYGDSTARGRSGRQAANRDGMASFADVLPRDHPPA